MYAYVFLVTDKSNAIDVFKIYKNRIKHQLEKTIKIVRSDSRGEYYGWYYNGNQVMRTFSNSLQNCGIIA